MNKIVKGALAAGTASVLLVGGAGTLAYWTADDDVDGATFTAGDLQIDASDCDSAGWTVTNSIEGVTDTAFDPATEAVVPGDTFTKECDVEVTAVGTNLRALLGVTGGAATGTMATSAYTVDSDFTLGGAAIDEITSDAVDKTIAAEITVTVPIGSTASNASKLKTIDLADFTVTATQATS